MKPGQQTNLWLEFTMHAGMEGPHDFRVHVRTNDRVEPDKVLAVKSNWVK